MPAGMLCMQHDAYVRECNQTELCLHMLPFNALQPAESCLACT